jgi:hypothetical protein
MGLREAGAAVEQRLQNARDRILIVANIGAAGLAGAGANLAEYRANHHRDAADLNTHIDSVVNGDPAILAAHEMSPRQQRKAAKILGRAAILAADAEYAETMAEIDRVGQVRPSSRDLSIHHREVVADLAAGKSGKDVTATLSQPTSGARRSAARFEAAQRQASGSHLNRYGRRATRHERRAAKNRDRTTARDAKLAERLQRIDDLHQRIVARKAAP